MFSLKVERQIELTSCCFLWFWHRLIQGFWENLLKNNCQVLRKLAIEKTIHANTRMKVYYIFLHQPFFITNFNGQTGFCSRSPLGICRLEPFPSLWLHKLICFYKFVEVLKYHGKILQEITTSQNIFTAFLFLFLGEVSNNTELGTVNFATLQEATF